MYVKCPIFVARQWMRHRMWSYNEVSYRYKKAPLETYYPEVWRLQHSDNKQMSAGELPDLENIKRTDDYHRAVESTHIEYQLYQNHGVAREMSRIVLPLATYTEFYATVDLRNLLHFIRLRQDGHAQQEIRVYAEVLAEWVAEHFPITWEAFKKWRINGREG